MTLKYTLVDAIPKSDSGESTQNSEPSVTVNPLDSSELILGAFGTTGSSYFKSTDGGVTWSDYGNVPSNDKSLAWKTDGSAALTVSMVDTSTPNTFSTYSGTTADSNFGSPINVFDASDIDQPWIRTGPSNHVYVAYNDLSKSGTSEGGSGNGETASVLVSTDGGKDYNPVTLDRVGTTFQDDPSVRLAVNGSTVYGVFVRWNSQVEGDANGDRYNSQVVVVRSDNGGADGFTALGPGGNGVQAAAPIDVFTQTGGTTLSIGKNRIAAEAAIAVDPNNANHVLVAYQNAPAAGQVQLVLAESTDGGATWSSKFTTSSSTRSGQAAISILADGAIGLLYDNFDPTTQKVSQHFLTTTNDFATTTDTTLATESNASPSVQFQPYLGDFFDLTSVGNTFCGTFCASNADDGTDAQFANLTLQRDFTGTEGTGTFQLTDANGHAVAASIDPFFFSCTLQPPTVAGLSNATYAASAPPVTLSPGLSLADVSSTTLLSATVQITGGIFTGDGDMLAANTTGTAITASYNNATETLTLTGSDTLADYQAVLDSVTFSSASDNPTNSGNDNTRTVTWSVNDGSFSSTPQNTSIAITAPANPQPPAGTTADMIMTQPSTGNYEIYDIGNNAILAAYPLTGAPTPWQPVGVGGFNGNDTSDLLLRNDSSGAFELFDVVGNNASGPVQMGAVGTDWSVLGFGDFSGNTGETDMLMRQNGTAKLEVYDISNNQITSAAAMGAVGPEWQFLGVGDFSSKPNETDMLMRNVNNGALEVYDISHNAIVSAAGMGAVGQEWQWVGVGDFSGNAGETDMLMRDTNNGALEVYNIHNNQVVSAQGMGAVGLEWSPVGIGDFSGNPGETDMIMRDANNGAFELYDISHDSIVSAASIGAVDTDWQTVGIAPYRSPSAAIASSGNSLLDSGATGGLQGAFDPAGGGVPASLPSQTSLADPLTTGLFGAAAPAAEMAAPTPASGNLTATLAGSLFQHA